MDYLHFTLTFLLVDNYLSSNITSNAFPWFILFILNLVMIEASSSSRPFLVHLYFISFYKHTSFLLYHFGVRNPNLSVSVMSLLLLLSMVSMTTAAFSLIKVLCVKILNKEKKPERGEHPFETLTKGINKETTPDSDKSVIDLFLTVGASFFARNKQ